MTDLAHESQILRRVSCADAAAVFVESYVQHPVQRVFNSPMSAHSLSGAFSIRLQARQVVSQFDTHLAVDLADGLDQDETAQIAPETKEQKLNNCPILEFRHGFC